MVVVSNLKKIKENLKKDYRGRKGGVVEGGGEGEYLVVESTRTGDDSEDLAEFQLQNRDKINIVFFDDHPEHDDECRFYASPKARRAYLPDSRFTITCVKVDRSNNLRKNLLFQKAYNEDYRSEMQVETDDVQLCVNTIQLLLGSFDYESGVTEQLLKTKMNKELSTLDKQFYVFDWDRTISQLAGFSLPRNILGTSHQLKYKLYDYAKWLNTFHFAGEKEHNWKFTNETILTAICGGAKRVKWLRDNIKAENSFFITEFKTKQLVIDLTKILLGENFDASNRVFSLKGEEEKKKCQIRVGILTKQDIIYDMVFPIITKQLE